MGHDEFQVVENSLVRRFPIYKDGDSNAKPSGKMRQLQYKLKAGEAGWLLKLECEPLGYDCDPGGRLRGLRVRHGGDTEESILDVGLVLEAMGLQVDEALRRALLGVEFNEHGLVTLTEGSLTTRPGVHAAGGLVNGGASVARCIAEGMAAADQIHASVAKEMT